MKGWVKISKRSLRKLVDQDTYKKLTGEEGFVRFSKKEVKAIEKRLIKEGQAMLKLTTKGNWEFVGNKFVTLKPRYSFERKDLLPAAIKAKNKMNRNGEKQ